GRDVQERMGGPQRLPRANHDNVLRSGDYSGRPGSRDPQSGRQPPPELTGEKEKGRTGDYGGHGVLRSGRGTGDSLGTVPCECPHSRNTEEVTVADKKDKNEPAGIS